MDTESETPKSSAESNPPTLRCPHCDTANTAETTLCIGCGHALSVENEKAQSKKAKGKEPSQREIDLGIVEPTSKPRPRHTVDIPGLLLKAATLLVIVAAVMTAIQLRMTPPPANSTAVEASPVVAAAIPTTTQTPFPTLTAVPSATPTLLPTATPEPTSTPTLVPTPTLEPPVDHQINVGEALYNIALRYSVSVDSIIALNPGLSPERIVSGSTIQVPRPTATPPLEPVLVSIGEESVVADPEACTQHEIQEADTFFGIARTYNVPLDALLVMNRLSAETILTPGDTVCIPTIIFNATSVDASSGDYGGAVDTSVPRLLYPPNSAEITTNPVTLQWLAQRELEPTEWYMIELTNLSDSGTRPQRGFSKSTSFQIPPEWLQPAANADAATYRWRVSYIQATSERNDGNFVYTFGGGSSQSTFVLRP